MYSIAFRRVVSQASRTCVRRTSTNTRLGSRRSLASDAHSTGVKKSSDTPWLIGSGAVTVLGAAYILSPPSKKPAHAAAVAAKAPIEHALPPPKEEKQAAELVKDDEGTEVNVNQSEQQSFNADSPKDAKAAEDSRFDDGAPGQTEEVHDVETPEQKEKPSGTKRSGTLPDDSNTSGPTDIGEARKQAKDKNSPKEAAEESES